MCFSDWRLEQTPTTTYVCAAGMCPPASEVCVAAELLLCSACCSHSCCSSIVVLEFQAEAHVRVNQAECSTRG